MKGGFKMALKDNSSPSDYVDNKLEQDEVKANKKEERIHSEYEASFDGAEKLEHQLMKIKSKLDISLKKIDIDNIVTSNFKKVARVDTLIGLKGIVGEWGVVSPIHVLALEHENMYVLLDGLRRVFASLRNGQKEIYAMVWDFEDKTEGKEMANVISLMINRSQHFSPKEMWEQMQILEETNNASPGLIEFLLQMNAGDAMKLKDIMLASKLDFAEIQASLMEGALTIDGAYKKLCNERKKLDKLAMEDSMSIEENTLGIGSVDGLDDVEPDDQQKLGVEEVREMLELDTDDLGEASLEDLNMSDEVRGNVVQDVKDRKPLDKELRQGVLMRDEFKCKCCGVGGTEAYLGILAVHHIIPVYLNGPDIKDNLVSLCVNCHVMLHEYVQGKMHVDLNELDEKEEQRFKNIFKYGNVAIKATKRVGMKKEDVIKADSGSTKHPMPGQNLKANKEAFESSKKVEN